MPELNDPYSEQIMETALLKIERLNSFDYSHAPNGPMKEELLGDSSVIKMQRSGGADEIVEAYITRRQELEVQDFTVFDCY